jgi:hypothetical protein
MNTHSMINPRIAAKARRYIDLKASGRFPADEEALLNELKQDMLETGTRADKLILRSYPTNEVEFFPDDFYRSENSYPAIDYLINNRRLSSKVKIGMSLNTFRGLSLIGKLKVMYLCEKNKLLNETCLTKELEAKIMTYLVPDKVVNCRSYIESFLRNRSLGSVIVGFRSDSSENALKALVKRESNMFREEEIDLGTITIQISVRNEPSLSEFIYPMLSNRHLNDLTDELHNPDPDDEEGVLRDDDRVETAMFEIDATGMGDLSIGLVDITKSEDVEYLAVIIKTLLRNDEYRQALLETNTDRLYHLKLTLESIDDVVSDVYSKPSTLFTILSDIKIRSAMFGLIIIKADGLNIKTKTFLHNWSFHDPTWNFRFATEDSILNRSGLINVVILLTRTITGSFKFKLIGLSRTALMKVENASLGYAMDLNSTVRANITKFRSESYDFYTPVFAKDREEREVILATVNVISSTMIGDPLSIPSAVRKDVEEGSSWAGPFMSFVKMLPENTILVDCITNEIFIVLTRNRAELPIHQRQVINSQALSIVVSDRDSAKEMVIADRGRYEAIIKIDKDDDLIWKYSAYEVMF